MGLILWIDHNSFSTGLIERVFKKKNLPFYSLGSVYDFSYLVDDLNPKLIVLDGETFTRNPEAFRKQYEASAKMQAAPFIVLEPCGDMSFIKNIAGELKKPLDPFEIPEQIQKMMSAN